MEWAAGLERGNGKAEAEIEADPRSPRVSCPGEFTWHGHRSDPTEANATGRPRCPRGTDWGLGSGPRSRGAERERAAPRVRI